MAKQMYAKNKTISIVGNLDKNDNDEYIVTVESKDSFTEYYLMDIIEDMVGTEISLKSVEDIIA